jgi:hypothetical protein
MKYFRFRKVAAAARAPSREQRALRPELVGVDHEDQLLDVQGGRRRLGLLRVMMWCMFTAQMESTELAKNLTTGRPCFELNDWHRVVNFNRIVKTL